MDCIVINTQKAAHYAFLQFRTLSALHFTRQTSWCSGQGSYFTVPNIRRSILARKSAIQAFLITQAHPISPGHHFKPLLCHLNSL